MQGDLFTLAYDGSVCSDIGQGVSTVAFHYHMYGADMGELRVRMMRALASMGKEEIQSIIEEQGKVEVTCEFCKDAVTFTEAELLGAKDEV